MLFVTTPTSNEKNGNGRYSTPRRRRVKKTAAKEFSYLSSSKDITMRFNNSKDPIYTVFEYMENRPVSQLMGEFVKDSFFEIANFVSKVIK